AEVGRAAQVQETPGHPVEPDDLALGVENDDTVGQRGGRALQLAHQLHESLLMKPLAAMQAHDLRDDLTEHATDIRWIGKAAMSQPPFKTEQVGELPAQMQSQRHAETDPNRSKKPAHEQTAQHRGEHSTRCKPPCLCRWLHE